MIDLETKLKGIGVAANCSNCAKCYKVVSGEFLIGYHKEYVCMQTTKKHKYPIVNCKMWEVRQSVQSILTRASTSAAATTPTEEELIEAKNRQRLIAQRQKQNEAILKDVDKRLRPMEKEISEIEIKIKTCEQLLKEATAPDMIKIYGEMIDGHHAKLHPLLQAYDNLKQIENNCYKQQRRSTFLVPSSEEELSEDRPTQSRPYLGKSIQETCTGINLHQAMKFCSGIKFANNAAPQRESIDDGNGHTYVLNHSTPIVFMSALDLAEERAKNSVKRSLELRGNDEKHD